MSTTSDWFDPPAPVQKALPPPRPCPPALVHIFRQVQTDKEGVGRPERLPFFIGWIFHGILGYDNAAFTALQLGDKEQTRKGFEFAQYAIDEASTKRLPGMATHTLHNIACEQKRTLEHFDGILRHNDDPRMAPHLRHMARIGIMAIEDNLAHRKGRTAEGAERVNSVNPFVHAHLIAHLLYVCGQRIAGYPDKMPAITPRQRTDFLLKQFLESALLQVPIYLLPQQAGVQSCEDAVLRLNKMREVINILLGEPGERYLRENWTAERGLLEMVDRLLKLYEPGAAPKVKEKPNSARIYTFLTHQPAAS